MPRTPHPRRCRLQVDLHRAQIQAPPPPAPLTVIHPTARLPAARAPQLLPPRRPDPGHHVLTPVRTDLQVNRLDHRVLDSKQQLPYHRCAPAVLLSRRSPSDVSNVDLSLIHISEP